MRKYETLMVLHPELPEAQSRETIDRVRRLLESNGGTDVKIQEWGMRELAYPIRKLNRGYYVLIEFSAPAAAVTELDRTLKIADEFLRFITVVASAVQRKVAPAELGTAAEPDEAEEEVDFDDVSVSAD